MNGPTSDELHSPEETPVLGAMMLLTILCVAAGVRVLAEKTVRAVGARLELAAPLENRVVDGAVPHSM